MILIGERINAGFKDIKEAIINKDPDPIREWAQKQTEKGATYLDVNMGTASANPDDFLWMIDTVQNEVETPICLDNNKLNVQKLAIPTCKKPPLVNSVLAIDEKMDEIFPTVAEYNASIIGLSQDAGGSPKNADDRMVQAGNVFAKAMEHGLDPDQLFLDPIVMPLKFMQEQAPEILKAAGQYTLFSDPSPHIVCGLSNISNGAKNKSLMDRTFITMLIANGADAAILDVMDDELVNAILTAELMMNRGIYADSYIEAFRG
ncbi:MAG: dihydropteroate synthase [Fibrobacteria bacterium]|nr:dihydropteroate synthase [Fibrobacteria bacterium]